LCIINLVAHLPGHVPLVMSPKSCWDSEMKRSMCRAIAKQKRFSLHWGSGVVSEEVQIITPYHLPTIQLLTFGIAPV